MAVHRTQQARWLNQEFKLPALAANGYQVVNRYATYLAAHPGAAPLQKVTPQTATSGSLSPGDVVSYAQVNNDNGHTNVVTSTQPAPFSGTGKVTTLNENTGGFFTLTVKNWKFGMKDLHGNFMAATGWLHISTASHPGSWTAAKAPLPANAAATPDVQLRGVACPSTTSCIAVGDYIDSSGNLQGLLVTGSGTSWTAIKAPLPADAAANQAAILYSVACPSTTSCVATGVYYDSSNHWQGLLVTGFGTSWTATQAPLPADAAADPVVSLNAVACPSTNSGTAAGEYEFSPGNTGTEGLLVTGPG